MSYNDVIGMAWADRISFEEIKKKTGLNEKEIIKIMRTNLKRKSYLLWRKRVRGRLTKPVSYTHLTLPTICSV